MRANTLHIFTRLLVFPFSKIYQKVTLNIKQGIKNKNHLPKVLLGFGITFSLNYVYAIEDETIRNLKFLMSKEINALRA
jgi:hypothetical protein